jgi:hypothetical protein
MQEAFSDLFSKCFSNERPSVQEEDRRIPSAWLGSEGNATATGRDGKQDATDVSWRYRIKIPLLEKIPR